MITYFSNDLGNLISESHNSDHLPKWAVDERLFNCDDSWSLRKSFFMKRIAVLLNLI